MFFIIINMQPQQPASDTPVLFSQAQTAAAGQLVNTSPSAGLSQMTAHQAPSYSHFHQGANGMIHGDAIPVTCASLHQSPVVPGNELAAQCDGSQTQSADAAADGYREGFVPGKHTLLRAFDLTALNAVRQDTSMTLVFLDNTLQLL